MVSGKSCSEGENNYIGCKDYLKQFQVWGLIKPANFWCKKVISPTLLRRYFICVVYLSARLSLAGGKIEEMNAKRNIDKEKGGGFVPKGIFDMGTVIEIIFNEGN